MTIKSWTIKKIRPLILKFLKISLANNFWDQYNWGSMDFNNILAVCWDYVNHRNSEIFHSLIIIIIIIIIIIYIKIFFKRFLYLVVNVSNVLLIISRWFLILFFCVIYEQLLSHFFLSRVIMTNKLLAEGKLWLRTLDNSTL